MCSEFDASILVSPVAHTATITATGGRSGQPIDVQPVLAATAGHLGNYAAIYGSQDFQHEFKPLFQTTSPAFGGGSGGMGGGFGGGGGGHASSFHQLPFVNHAASSHNDSSFNGVPNVSGIKMDSEDHVIVSVRATAGEWKDTVCLQRMQQDIWTALELEGTRQVRDSELLIGIFRIQNAHGRASIQM